VEQVEQAMALDVEDNVELAWVLIRQ